MLLLALAARILFGALSAALVFFLLLFSLRIANQYERAVTQRPRRFMRLRDARFVFLVGMEGDTD
jgi:regulator of protease activity HflC (stomatin/prohibitin superfamily)